ncbi:hypothetical protein [Parapedobacter sp. 2B3]|uniref:phosphoribosyltransferase-like protein n=1 Tax=Parapedobacter sp. 2B3 TaxID=3342381 RepID=UPI0035B68ED0
MNLKKRYYNKLVQLYIRQNWLNSKEAEIDQLLKLCNNEGKENLVFKLLSDFSYLNNDNLSMLLNDIATYIINETGFVQKETQILAITQDDNADSGQKMLDQIKVPLFKLGWRSPELVNNFSKVAKRFNKGLNKIVIVDEFVGSGKTLRGKLNFLQGVLNGDYQVKFCFLAGIKTTIDQLRGEGVDIFCPLQLTKGISESFAGVELKKAEDNMLELELELAEKINDKQLFDYSFGYGGAEALYTMEGCNGNTPNSVFPIFWWLLDKKNNLRNTLLTRYEKGFEI